MKTSSILKKLGVTVCAMMALSSTALASRATVTVDSLNLREEAMTGAVLTRLSNGSEVDVFGVTDDNWFRVHYDGFTGYVSGEYLSMTEAALAEVPYIPPVRYGYVESGPLNVRFKPGTDSEVINILNPGTVVEIINENDGWYEISEGFIFAEYVQVVEQEEAVAMRSQYTVSTTGQAIADYALSLYGSPYVYGGTSLSGFDCSGFVQYVYKNFGLTVSRTARAQYASDGVAVSKANLQPGDMVFFNAYGYVNHAAIYIGNNKIIHASTPSSGVTINSLTENWYTTYYAGAKRMV